MAFLILGVIGNETADAKKVRWDHYLFTGINHPVSVYLRGFADEVKKRTNGQLEIISRPAGELPFRATEAIKIVSDGSVQLAQGYVGFISGEAPLAGLPGMPFLLSNTKDVEKLWPIIKKYTEKEFSRYGVTTLFYFCWPPQNLYATGKLIQTVEDFAGRKIRATDPKQTAMLRLMKASSITLTTAEVPLALQRGVMEGVFSAAFNVVGAKWADLVKWAWLPDVNPGGPDFCIVNKKALAELSPDVRNTLMEVAKEWTVKMNTEIAASEQGARETLRTKFNVDLFYPRKSTIDTISKLMVPYWEKWAKDHGANGKAYLEEIRKALGK
jgi:TRAP-type C4-dicarboxylate transport system substrate-binding protein